MSKSARDEVAAIIQLNLDAVAQHPGQQLAKAIDPDTANINTHNARWLALSEGLLALADRVDKLSKD